MGKRGAKASRVRGKEEMRKGQIGGMGVCTDFLPHADHPGKMQIASLSGEWDRCVLLSYSCSIIPPLLYLAAASTLLSSDPSTMLFLESTFASDDSLRCCSDNPYRLSLLPDNFKSCGSLKSGEAKWRTVEDGGREFVIPLEVFGTNDDGYNSFDDAAGRSMLLK